MAGYRHILEIEELKAKCDSMGFRITIGKEVDARRARKEQDWRNKELVKILTKE